MDESRFVRVFRWDREWRGDPEVSLWACSYRNGRLTRLENNYDEYREARDPASPIALAGDRLAYASDLTDDHDPCCWSAVTVVNAYTGRRRVERAFQREREPNDIGSSEANVRSIVLKANGAVAWISQGYGVDWHVYRRTSRARTAERLDSGAKIGPRTLRLVRSRLTWRHDGRVRTASLQ